MFEDFKIIKNKSTSAGVGISVSTYPVLRGLIMFPSTLQVRVTNGDSEKCIKYRG